MVAMPGCTKMWGLATVMLPIMYVTSLMVGGLPCPSLLLIDGDLLLHVQQGVRWRGRGNTRVTKVKGHADDGMVAYVWVREVDPLSNNEADVAADMGRKRVHCSVTDARWIVHGACARWYPRVQDLHRFFIAIAGMALKSDG